MAPCAVAAVAVAAAVRPSPARAAVAMTAARIRRMRMWFPFTDYLGWGTSQPDPHPCGWHVMVRHPGGSAGGCGAGDATRRTGPGTKRPPRPDGWSLRCSGRAAWKCRRAAMPCSRAATCSRLLALGMTPTFARAGVRAIQRPAGLDGGMCGVVRMTRPDRLSFYMTVRLVHFPVCFGRGMWWAPCGGGLLP